MQDLGLGNLLEAMALGDNFPFEVSKVAILSGVSDVTIILRRSLGWLNS